MPNDVGAAEPRASRGRAKTPAVAPYDPKDFDVWLATRDQPAIPRKRIAIFGTTPSRLEGPHQDDAGWDERWTIGPGGKDVHNWERLFEVHGHWPADFRDYLNDLSKVEPPRQVVTIPRWQNPNESWADAIAAWKAEHKLGPDAIEGDWKAIVRYPRERVLNRWPRRMWFSSSISWTLALAIEEGATEIGMWGIDLEAGEEYISQFIGCAFMIDVARLLGIDIALPKGCGLMRDPAPYPDRYETAYALYTERKSAWLRFNLNQLEPQFEACGMHLFRKEGECMTLKAMGAPAEAIQKAEQELMQLNGHRGQLACQVNQLKGSLDTIEQERRMWVIGIRDPQEPFL